MPAYPRPLSQLIEQLEKLPGVGPKSAQRIALFILKSPRLDPELLAGAIAQLRRSIRTCRRCGNYTDTEECDICRDASRDAAQLCVVADARELLAIERSGSFLGRYHVLGGLLNPLDGIGPEELALPRLLQRIRDEGVREVIVALSPTVEGETTLHYLVNILRPQGVRLTGLARGLPFGGDLDYADQLTISGALQGRREL